jgi:hypothetical protein
VISRPQKRVMMATDSVGSGCSAEGLLHRNDGPRAGGRGGAGLAVRRPCSAHGTTYKIGMLGGLFSTLSLRQGCNSMQYPNHKTTRGTLPRRVGR